MKFAKRMERMQSSEIRELLKLTAQPDIISFAGGLPAPELFPVKEIAKVSHDLVEKEGQQLLQYATTEGRPTLRAKIAARMKDKYHTEVDPDEILITTGSQQCLDFAGKLFLDPGDVVLCESPSYLGALNAFNAYEPTFVEVPTDNVGLIPEELDKILSTTDRCKFIYVIPDFQNPTGRTWSLERRKKFMEVINKHNLPVLEDNPYGELRYEGEILPSLKSMDTKGLVMNGIHPDDLERVEQIASRAMDQDSEYEVKYRMKKKDGSYIWVSDVGKKVLAVNGNAACISVIRDISGEIEAKQKLYEESVENRQQKNILQNIIDTMPSGLLQCSFDRIPKTLMVNRTGANILGFENEHEFFLRRDVCDNILRCIHPEDRTKVLEELFSIAEEGIVKNSSHRIKTAAGEERWVRSAACVIQNQQGEKIYQIIFHDVTEILQLRRKNQQWDLMERSALYTAITSAYPMIIFGNLTRNTCSVLDQEGQSLHSLDCGSYDAMVNGVLGSVAPEYRDEFTSKFARQNQLAEYERGAHETYMEHRQLLDDGQYHWVSAHKIKVENPVNDDILTVSLIRCIDEQKDNEAEKNQILRTALGAAEAANNAKTEFLSRMSHEIRTPMNAIIGMTAIALSALDNKERISDCLAKIGISARFLLSLINDILDMSRIESGRMSLAHEKFDFEEMINGLNSLFYPQAEEKGLKFNTVIEGMTEELYIGDSLRLRQILLNILSNALKFTPEGGRIQFTIRQMSRGNKDAWLRFTVSDTGIGMSKVFQKHLFESFEQENPNISIKYGGTGLGLAICKNLVTLMGGSINVHSIEGVGSEFCVDVKLGLTEESYRRKNLDLLKFRDLKTLIVDDDIVTCEHASLIMSDLGVQAEYVTSGALAVLEIEKGIREMNPYDIVLVDLKMPDMDGIQTTKAIRRLVGAETLVVVMTAYEWKELEADARHAGVDFFITKPLFRSELVDLFEKINDFSEAVYEPEAAKGEVQFAGERILLVEDNELNLEVAASLLEMKGLTIESACNGLQALEKFCSTPVGYYDAVLMDIRMPVMDGLEAARNIRLFDKSDAQTIPIIAMTCLLYTSPSPRDCS